MLLFANKAERLQPTFRGYNLGVVCDRVVSANEDKVMEKEHTFTQLPALDCNRCCVMAKTERRT